MRLPSSWVRSVKEECLSRLIFFGEHSLRRGLTEYIDHFHREQNHQGKGNNFVFPTTRTDPTLRPGSCAMQRTTRWLTAILRGPSNMNTGSDYHFDRTTWCSMHRHTCTRCTPVLTAGVLSSGEWIGNTNMDTSPYRSDCTDHFRTDDRFFGHYAPVPKISIRKAAARMCC
jgi:hypothetical protein